MNKNINKYYWINIAKMVAEASTCFTKVGAIIIYQNEIKGMGYSGSIHKDDHCINTNCIKVNNHFEKGFSNSGESCIRTIHAEINAILKCNIRGTIKNWLEIYTTHQPCLDCIKISLQIGIRKFYWIKDYRDINRDIYLSNINKNIRKQIYLEKVSL